MAEETLEDHLRQATRSFTSRLSEEAALALGRDLALELERAHTGAPPRFPGLDPALVPMANGKPRLDGGAPQGDPREALFALGALLQQLMTGTLPHVSWRLDGPPAAALSSLTRRALLSSLMATTPGARFESAARAAEALVAELAANGPAAPTWPLFRGDPTRAGAAPRAQAATGLTPAWVAAIGNVVASPVLTSRLVFVVTSDGRLVVLERATGRLTYTMRVGSASESTPALAGDRLFVGSDEGQLVSLDVNTGAEVFRTGLGKMVRSSPLPLADRIVVGVVDSKEAGAVVAVEIATGKPLWRRKLGAVFSSAAAEDGRLIVGSDAGALQALDPDKGTVLWTHEIGARVRATPAISGGLAIVGDFEGRLVAVRTSDGTRAWTRELGQPIYSSVCIASDLAVVGCHDGVVRGFTASTGEPRFEAPTRGPVVASPVAAGPQILVGSTDGDFYLLDATGQVRARSRLAEGGTQSSAAVDAVGPVVGSSRGVHAFTLGS